MISRKQPRNVYTPLCLMKTEKLTDAAYVRCTMAFYEALQERGIKIKVRLPPSPPLHSFTNTSE